MKLKLSKKLLKKINKVLLVMLCVVLSVAFAVGAVNIFVCADSGKRIVSTDTAREQAPFDCILVLGAGIVRGRPSDMLADRLLAAVELYQLGVAPKILVSGDHGSTDYDEVNVMKNYVIEQGVPSEDVFMDHAGFSTYDSVYRAINIFGAEKILIVTQRYHLYRAVYIAKHLGAEALGVNSDPRTYIGQPLRECRELAARVKDFVMCIFKPQSSVMGSPISLDGDGNVTNDN